MEKKILELRGIACIGLENQINPRRNIISSRSFGRNVNSLEEIEEAIASYTAKAASKMRIQGTRASGIYVYLKPSKYLVSNITRPHKFTNSRVFTKTISDTSYLITIAKDLVKEIYVYGTKYKKAGVMLIDLKNQTYIQQSFFDEAINLSSNLDNLMVAIDKTNQKFGRDTVFFAAEGIKKQWQMKRERKSPSYTTNWKQLPMVV